MKELSCEQRIDATLKGRLEDLNRMLGGEISDELGRLGDYALSFDYVAPGTFDDQDEGYFRYQISWGGPSDEFRFFTGPDFRCSRIEYWFLDWFDGSHRDCSRDATALSLWRWLVDTGAVNDARREARLYG